MGQRRKSVVTRDSAAEQELRDQEVLRANRELAAYFKGQRTEREARAALKIIKAFVRARAHQNAKSRAPLPGSDVAKTPKEVTNRKAARENDPPRQRKPRRRKRQHESSRSVTASIEPPANPDPLQLPEIDEKAPE